MTLHDVKEYLKKHIQCDNWYVGKIDAGQECCIGVFSTQGSIPVMAIGGRENTSYMSKAASVLVHWGKYATPAEEKAQEVYDLLFGVAPVIGGKETIKIDLRTAEPVGIGTDSKGVFEFVINFVIYYKKG